MSARSWREEHQSEDGSYDAETWGAVDERGERVTSAATTERQRLWREHELLVRLSREHGRRMGHLAAQVQPVLRRIWEIDNGK